jgi:RimJ/RimL family protein N-acetyltransferase
VQTGLAYFLKTARLGFRLWCMDDLPLALALWGDISVTRFIGGPFSEKQIQERLTREIASMQTNGIQYWPLFVLAEGDFVGCCGLRPYRPEEKICELGFHLRPAYWDKGFAAEAAQAVIKHAYESLRAKGLFAGHSPENLASRKVLQKLGFRFTHEELYAPTGKMHSCYFLNLPVTC